MESMLRIREATIRLYKQFEAPLNFLGRLVVGIIIYNTICKIGFYNEAFEPFFTAPLQLPVILLLGVSFVILPITLTYSIMILLIAVQISAYTELAAIIFLGLLCVLFFYARLAPKESILILLTLAGFYFKIPYLVPILAGLYVSVTALIPIGIGVFLWNFIPIVADVMESSTSAGLNVMDMPETLSSILPTLLNSLTTQREWLFTAFIFAMVVMAVHGISRISLDYAKEIGIGLGALLAVISFIIAQVLAEMEISIFSTIFFIILSAAIAEVIRFFDVVLDYGSSERVEFEDEDNYYFVKVVPKVILSKYSQTRGERLREEVEE